MYQAARTLALCLLFWLALFTGRLAAHPHVFVDCEASLILDAQGLSAIRQNWIFDEFFTAMILGDLGLPPDKPLNAADQVRIRDHAFINLKNFNYFTSIRMNGKPVPTPGYSRFAARLVEGRLVYDFDLPLRAEVGKSPLRLSFSVFDESYYTQIEFPPRDLGLEGAAPFSVSWDVRQWSDKTYYFGQVVPMAVEAVIARK